jgi:hypothetical protein
MEPKPLNVKDWNLEAPDEDAPTMADIRAHSEDMADAERKGEL